MKLKKSILTLCLLSSAAPSLCLANTQHDQATKLQLLNKQIKLISHQMQSMQTELSSLRSQMKNLKRRPKRVRHTTHRHASSSHHQKNNHRLTPEQVGRPVLIAPYMGNLNARYSESKLTINTTHVGRNAALLVAQKHYRDSLKKVGLLPPQHPVVSLSGEIEGQIAYTKPYNNPSKISTDLRNAKLNTLIIFNPWLMGFVNYAYDSSVGTPASPAAGRYANSRLYLQTGYLTIGNLEKSPFYFTTGQYFMPFGRYNSAMVSDTLADLLGENISRGFSVGYIQPGKTHAYARAFMAQGDTKIGNDGSRINNWGGSLGYVIRCKKWFADMGTSYMANIADSAALQSTGGSGFEGFGQNAASESLVHRVPAWDLHASIGHGPFDFISEYTGAIVDFSKSNLSFNNRGAAPRAYHVEGIYNFNAWKHASSFALSYGRSYEALGLSLPEQRYMSTITTSIMHNATFSLELRHDINYGKTDSATGQGVSVGTASDLGHSSNTVTGMLRVVF